MKSVIVFCLMVISCSTPQPDQALNRLKNASSPYLQEHADNLVDWYEWGDEALAKAKKEDKPLLISIGYASCHWCHVMESESFMDTAVARIMNESFVCIKVDREERPDIDNIYLHACQLLNNGESGWPLNAFALPDGKPFFAGTYYNTESWLQLLKQISSSYKTKRNKVILQANSLTYGMIDNDQLMFQKKASIAEKTAYEDLFKTVESQLDEVNGGLLGKQKFPTPILWDWLLQYQYLSKNKRVLELTNNTLTKMALGGIYDHVGGGFARYATDTEWRVPHFEKMLYDNAQLVSVYAQAYKVTRNPLFKQVVEQTLDFVERDLSSKVDGFYSSLNADTKEGEGAFYTWKHKEFTKALTLNNKEMMANYYQVSKEGNWKNGNNILYARLTPEDFAKSNKVDVKDFYQAKKETADLLLSIRNKRIKPSADTKILTSWNALMISGYIDAFTATGESTYLQMALKNARFLDQTMLQSNGALMRVYKDGNTSIPGFLDDYAFLANAFIQLYGVTLDEYWLVQAKKISDYVILHFYDTKSGMFFYTPDTNKNLIVQKIEVSDQEMPSSNAIFAKVLYGLGTFFDDEKYIEKSARMTLTMSKETRERPAYFAAWAKQWGILAYGTYEIAVMGSKAISQSNQLQNNYLPNCFFMGSVDSEDLPILKGKLQKNKTMIYVCNNKACKFPVQDVAQALKQIN